MAFKKLDNNKNLQSSKIVLFSPANGNNFRFLEYIKTLYNKFSDGRIYDLTTVSSKRALEYLDRIDLSKPNSISVLKTSLRHRNKRVILKGIDILKKIRTIDSKKVLCTALSIRDQEVILSAIDALRLFKSPELVRPLSDCLARKDIKIATAALMALAEIKTPEAYEAIKTVFDYKDDKLKQMAFWVLKGNKPKKIRQKA